MSRAHPGACASRPAQTVGFNVETIEYRNLKLTIWDVGGQDRIRPLCARTARAVEPGDTPSPSDLHSLICTLRMLGSPRAGKHYYHGTDALIFVVDSNDRERLSEARDELRKVLADDDMPNPLVLVYANKMDIPGALSPSAVSEGLGLHVLKETWYLQPSSAATGEGLAQGLDWLSTQIKLRPVAKPARGAGS
jgi:ADP-ribosylation factor protein 6